MLKNSMDSLQRLLDRINEKHGGIGSVIVVTFLVLVFIYSLGPILEGVFGH